MFGIIIEEKRLVVRNRYTQLHTLIEFITNQPLPIITKTISSLAEYESHDYHNP